MQAWYMPGEVTDQRAPNKLEPNEPVDLDTLASYGVLYWKLSGAADDEELLKIKTERGYDYSDNITCSPEKLPNYEEKIKSFFEEHIHTDEEIRYIMDGSGYFDIRDKDDRWIRMEVTKGDLIILPEGIYHRFTLDSNDHIQALRLFKGVPVWTPHNRDADGVPEMPSREKYVTEFLQPLLASKRPRGAEDADTATAAAAAAVASA
ncbi:unnamed protein product [Symbiodinium sp. KB8]|nr:unnamed protein product [Symbiodinium sp. KB8]